MTWSALVQRATSRLRQLSLSERYERRLKFEIQEIEKQGANRYWTDLFQEGQKFQSNPSHLVLPWLLGMVQTDPLKDYDPFCTTAYSKVQVYYQQHGKLPIGILQDPDVPDIDLDCLPEARDPIKEYAIQRYGSHIKDGYGSVCSVGTWTTYLFRSALQDVARATRLVSKEEILVLTKPMPEEVDSMKDGGYSTCKGKTTDPKTGEEVDCKTSHKLVECPKCGSRDTDTPTIGRLLEEMEPLRAFAEKYPRVFQLAIDLIGRIKSKGMHAGAIIITDRPLFGNIPLAKASKSGHWVSMWSEGRNTQLSKFGYTKWDILGLKTLRYIHTCCRLIEQNRGISFGDKFCGLDNIDPELGIAGSYWDGNGQEQFIRLDDEHALRLANDSKTDGVFQFDTELAKSILANGVRNFNDLLLFNAMGHPGPMQSIPDAVKNRDDKQQTWKGDIPPQLLPILESTYGVLCFHEDTLIAMGDGRQLPIRDVRKGDLVNSVDLASQHRVVEPQAVLECLPTLHTDGIEITLENGYALTVTKPHQIYGWGGYKVAGELRIGDLVAVPLRLVQRLVESQPALADWLGTDEAVAYLLGQLTGDGMCTGSSINLVTGNEESTDTLRDWIGDNLHLNINKYFHCRSWYLGLSSSEAQPHILPTLDEFSDTAEWWSKAYSLASGSDITMIIGRSDWFVYDRLRRHRCARGTKKRSRLSKFQCFIRSCGLKRSLYHKRVPVQIMLADRCVRAAYLAGLLDSDGSATVAKNGVTICHITSVSRLLLEDVRHLLSLEGIAHKLYPNRVFIWDTIKFAELLEHNLVLRSFDGHLLTGDNLGWVPKQALRDHAAQYGGLRAFERATGVGRQILMPSNEHRQLVRTATARKAGMQLGWLRYYRVSKIRPVANQQFYDLAVAKNSNVVANGMLAHNCFQEQLQSAWQVVGGFTAPEAQDARKAVAKKWVHKLKPIEKKWVDGATPVIGAGQAKYWWTKMVTFGRYAFNKCLDQDTILTDAATGKSQTVHEWCDGAAFCCGKTAPLPTLLSRRQDRTFGLDKCVDIHSNGRQEVFEVQFDDDTKECLTMDHQLLCTDGEFHTVREIVENDLELVTAPEQTDGLQE